jgi:hypothetical protein
MRTYQSNKAEQAKTVGGAITRFQTEREALWHALAVQHQQRSLILTALESIDAKLAALLDIAMRKGGLP